jgi:predicted DNA binding CopG/RHH family protein
MKKALQYYTRERLEEDSKLSPTQIAKFLEDFRLMQSENVKEMTAISMRIDTFLLESFKDKCLSEGLGSYQKQIRLLMTKWLQE